MSESSASLPLLAWIALAACLVGVIYFFRRNTKQGQFPNPIQPEPKTYLETVSMVSYPEIKAEYDRRVQTWCDNDARIKIRRHTLQSLRIEEMSLQEVISNSTSEERANLAAILSIEVSTDPLEVADALREAGSHTVASFFRKDHVPYEEVVSDVAKKLGAKNLPSQCTASELERLAVGAAVKQMLAKASPEERKGILTEFAKSQKSSSTGLVTTTGALALANLSGFGLYLAASTTLGAITSAVGVTLPFAAYTGMSSVLAAVTGPLGWAALAVAAIVKFGGTDFKKTVPGVLAVATIRARLIANRDQELFDLTSKSSLLEEERGRLDLLAKFMKKMEQSGQQSVPRSSVPW